MKLLLAIVCLAVATGDAAPSQPAPGAAESKRLLEELVGLVEEPAPGEYEEESPYRYPLDRFGSDERHKETYQRIECESL